MSQKYPPSETNSNYQLTTDQFGTMPDGRAVRLFTLANNKDVRVQITNYGGIITSLYLPDRHGNVDDVVLGFDTLDKYLQQHPYFGCIIGPYANRIDNGSFELNGQTYTLASNDGPHHLHGGVSGFDDRLWEATTACSNDSVQLQLNYTSEDMEEGYPGTLTVQVTYQLTNQTLVIDYRAETDTNTIVNLTNHAYFHLTGHKADHILDHKVKIHADQYTPIDDTLIPTGHIEPVADTPLDFTSPTAIGKRIDQNHEQLKHGHGYDHNYVLDPNDRGQHTPAAEVHDPSSGRTLTVHTTKPGMQFYSGNLLEGPISGKEGASYDKHSGFCLEPQYFPDAPNKSHFPSPVLEPDDVYRHTTTYEFGVKTASTETN